MKLRAHQHGLPLLFTLLTLVLATVTAAPAAIADEPSATAPAELVDATPAADVDAPSDASNPSDGSDASGEQILAPAPADVPPAADDRISARATALSIARSRSSVTYGEAVTLSGVATGSAGGDQVLVEQYSGGAWSTATTDLTAAGGAWSVAVTPTRTTTYRARMADSSATSGQLGVTVLPKLVITQLPNVPAFVPSALHGRVYPSTWRGRVTASVYYGGRRTGRVSGRPRSGGILDLQLPTYGVGRLRVSLALPAANGLAATSSTRYLRTTTRSLSAGDRGRDVRALEARLRELGFHSPGRRSRFDARVGDMVLAFHKYHRMDRRSTVSRATWRRMATARRVRPHFKGSGSRIEVDKSRQILTVVRRGRAIGTIHVSTGATGNTPVGRFHVYQRGGSYLYRFMAFVGNFGIHGYVPVPAYPASHGCVREPMWAASWTWANSRYGTPVIIHT